MYVCGPPGQGGGVGGSILQGGLCSLGCVCACVHACVCVSVCNQL